MDYCMIFWGVVIIIIAYFGMNVFFGLLDGRSIKESLVNGIEFIHVILVTVLPLVILIIGMLAGFTLLMGGLAP